MTIDKEADVMHNMSKIYSNHNEDITPNKEPPELLKTAQTTEIQKFEHQQVRLDKFRKYSPTTTEITKEERQTWMNAARIEKI